MPDRAPDDLADDDRHAAIRGLRRHHLGTLQHHERVAQVKLIVESSSGRLVMPVEPGFARDGETMLLWLPAESDWDLQASVISRPIDHPESVEAVDRWQAYHGGTSLSTWARFEIDGGKTDRAVFSAEDIQRPNPLGRGEYALIKRANADRLVLAGACKNHAATLISDPLCVGADPYGLDVRARFGIIRLEFPPGIEASTPERCEREIARLLGVGAIGGPS
jgi:hypothetical protein